jgi:hypothetical protein
MAFRITKKTRILIPMTRIHELKEDHGDFFKWLHDFLSIFTNETGLKITSFKRKNCITQGIYFAVEDKHKFLLSKIKYGI